MIQELLPLLGNGPANLNLFCQIATGICVVGLLLWLVGARYSRQIVTLVGVAGGTLAGKHLPDFVAGINFSAPVLAILGALIFGVAAFVTHRLWIGLSLGTMLAAWASLGTWALMHGQAAWSPPTWDADMNIQSFGTQLWSALPSDVTRIGPWAAGCAMISGIALTILWPKMATALHWSVAGMSAIVCAGLAAISFARPEWLGYVPAKTVTQIATFAGLVIFGALIQWKLTPRGAAKAPKVEKSE